MTAWTRMERPLVLMFPNSTSLPFAGIWNSSPGVSSTNSTVATITGPQSAIFLLRSMPLSPFLSFSLLSPTLRSQLWFKIDEEMIRRGVVSMGWGGCEVMWFCNFCLPFVICHHPPQMALSSNSTHPLLCQIIFIPDSCPFPLFSF